MIVEGQKGGRSYCSRHLFSQDMLIPFLPSCRLEFIACTYWVIKAGIEAAKVSPALGIRPATFCDPCPEIIEVFAELDCGNHSNNY